MQVLSVAEVAVQAAQPSPQATANPENKAYPAVAVLQVLLSEQSEHPVIVQRTQVVSKYHPVLQLYIFYINIYIRLNKFKIFFYITQNMNQEQYQRKLYLFVFYNF